MQHAILCGNQRNRPGDFVAGDKRLKLFRDGGKLSAARAPPEKRNATDSEADPTNIQLRVPARVKIADVFNNWSRENRVFMDVESRCATEF